MNFMCNKDFKYNTLAFAIIVLFASLLGCDSQNDKPIQPTAADGKSKIPNTERVSTAAGNDNVEMHYWLALITKPREIQNEEVLSEFEDDTVLRISDVPFGEMLIPYVNGSPVGAYVAGGKLVNITMWMTPGTNRIVWKGNVTVPAFFKVITSKKPTIQPSDYANGQFLDIESVVAKRMVNNSDPDQSLVFDADVEGVFSKSCDVLDTSQTTIEGNKEQARQHLRDVIAAYNNRDVDKSFEMKHAVLHNRKLNSYFKLFADERILARDRSVMERQMSVAGFRCTTDVSEVTFVHGHRSFVVYRGGNESAEVPFKVFVMKFDSDDGVVYGGPLTLMRVDGKWLMY